MNKVEDAIEKERIIKSKLRVQKHGEVFTPKKIVNQMLNLEEINNACNDLQATFLEPAAGEGAFLKEIIRRKLKMIVKDYNNTLTMYENYSLLALSTIYGIELLEDNAQACSLNIFQVYYEEYNEVAKHYNKKVKKSVLESAKVIISANIAQGNFLTRLSPDGKPIVFSEWKPLNLNKDTKVIKVIRTEFTLDDISNRLEKEDGQMITEIKKNNEQIDMFEFIEEQEIVKEISLTQYRYVPTSINNVYKEEMEVYDR